MPGQTHPSATRQLFRRKTMHWQRIIIALVFAGFIAVPEMALANGVHEKGPVPIVISNGRKVKLADYLVPGKTTVFDFYSEYCPTCRALAPSLKKLHSTRDDIALVLVDINRPGVKGIDWDSPVSLQFDLPSTPQFKVYAPDGKLEAEGRAAYDMIKKWTD
jgi:thiol-disulfide isomerase/thioredoxin